MGSYQSRDYHSMTTYRACHPFIIAHQARRHSTTHRSSKDHFTATHRVCLYIITGHYCLGTCRSRSSCSQGYFIIICRACRYITKDYTITRTTHLAWISPTIDRASHLSFDGSRVHLIIVSVLWIKESV